MFKWKTDNELYSFDNIIEICKNREQGDLSENADYDAAKTEQAEIEKRIKFRQSEFCLFPERMQ